jgi:cysteine desulfurase/selenocysteine lyase
VARLLNAEAEEIAITKNASEGINILAAGLDWNPGDNMILCPDLEHPNNLFPWYNLRRSRGIEIRTVPARDGHVPVERMVQAMDDRTRAVTASHVTFSPGFQTDVGNLAGAARARGVLTLVDAAQSAGCLATDVRALGVDGLAMGAQKSLLGLYGLGFLYVRREVVERISPVYAARYGVDLGPAANETSTGSGELSFKPGALRFELSNYSYIALAALEPALRLILSIGVDTIEAHVRRLAVRLAEGLLALGLPVAGGDPGPHLVHIVSVGRMGSGRGVDPEDPAMASLFRHLTDRRVVLSIRQGTPRLSLAVYNNDDDVDTVLSAVREWSHGH